MTINEQIDELLALHERADIDPLQSTHIISTGFTHLANLTERIQEGGGKGGRGRCLAMIPKEWADYLAALDNRTPALLRVLRTLLEERDVCPYTVSVVHDPIWYAAIHAADDAIREAETEARPQTAITDEGE